MLQVANTNFEVPLEYVKALLTEDITVVPIHYRNFLDQFIRWVTKDLQLKYYQPSLIWELNGEDCIKTEQYNDLDLRNNVFCQTVFLSVYIRNDYEY